MSEADEVASVLSRSIAAGDADSCHDWVDSTHGLASVRTLAGLTDGERERLLALLSPREAAEVIEQLPEAQAIEAMEHIDVDVAARILEALPSDERVDLIQELGHDEAEAILDAFSKGDADDMRRLAAYDEDSAGGLMVTEFLAVPVSGTVREVLAQMEDRAEAYARFNIQYTYAVHDDGRLAGVLPIRRLLLSPRHARIGDLVIPDPVALLDTAPLEDVSAEFREHPFIGLPVVNEAGRLVGVVERAGIERALAEDADERYRQAQGIVGGEELRSMPLLTRSRRRLAWLSLNIVLNLVAASVIAMHQETLEAVIALAVFLPIISDMSGCSGNQAVAVSMRELTLGVTRSSDVGKVLGKEITVGAINGFVLGAIVAGVALLWKGNWALGAVVGVALMLNTVIAVSIGGAVPLVLKALRLDPALASGPILTTMTDLCGFLLVLSFAAAAMSQLT